MTFLSFSSPYLWLSLGFALILLEMLIPGIFLLWVGLAALLVSIPAGMFELNGAALCLLYVGAMAISVWIGVKVQARNAYQASNLNQGLGSYVGTVATVAEVGGATSDALRIHLVGTTYSARCNEKVEVGDDVEIVSIAGTHFTVKKLTAKN